MQGFQPGHQLSADRTDYADMANKLDIWSKRDDALALCDFCVEQDIWAQRIYDWRDASSIFAETLKKAKLRISSRLRKQLHNKENPYNYGLFMSEIGFHDQFHHDYQKSLKEQDAEIRAKAENKNQERVINVYCNSDLAAGSTHVSTKTLSDANNKGAK